jgi:hypothetical protein
MAHYALLDNNGIVTSVIVGEDDGDQGVDWEAYFAELSGQVCKRTSYNTQGGIHLHGGVPFRKNYAGIGYTYDADRDAFIPPKPYASWLLDEDTCLWIAPVPYPEDGKRYAWNEQTLSWDEITQE